MTTLVSLAEYGRLHGVSKQAAAKWKARGRLVLSGDKIDVEASDARMRDAGKGRFSSRQPREPASVATARRRQPGPPDRQPEPRWAPADVRAFLAPLDWKGPEDWSDAAIEERARQAAAVVGWVVEKSSAPLGPENLGRYRLVDREGYVTGGDHYELFALDVVAIVREWVVEDDEVEGVVIEIARPDLLPALARPIWPSDWPNAFQDLSSPEKFRGPT